MKKLVCCCVAALLVMAMNVTANAAVFGTTDLLNGEGSFETQGAGGAGNWTFWSDGGQTSTIDSTSPRSGSYSWHAHCPTSGKQARAYNNGIATVANRQHHLSSYVRQYASSASFIRWSLGASGQQNFGSLYYSYAHYNNYYTTAAAENSVDLGLYYRSNSAPNDHGMIDDVTLYRELAMPIVEDVVADGSGYVLTNNGGVTGASDQLVAFDPDVVVSYVSGFDVGAITTAWDSDNQLHIDFANTLSGTVTLQATNPYGQVVSTFTVPEPATMALLGLGAFLLRRKR